MDLTRLIRRERTGRKARKPFVPSLFTRIAGIVHRYGLDEDFLEKLDAAANLQGPACHRLIGVISKAAHSHSLFALVTEKEYRITEAILQRVGNPYLQYAHTPEEILVCNSLFALDPSIDAERLMHHHFMSLLEEALILRGLEPKPD